jgi:hypothetical protein
MACAAVLIADDRSDGHLAVRVWVTGVVGIGQFGVQPPQDTHAGAAVLTHPRRRGYDQDVGCVDLVADRRPRVTAAHVGLHAGLHVVVDDPDRLAGNVVRLERV